MSPLQVTDQMACGEGRPCTLRLSQQDRSSRASCGGGMAGQRGWVPTPEAPSRPPAGPPPAHPVAHVLLGGSGQAHRPPLPCPLGGVHGEGVLGLTEHGDQRRHLVEEHVDVLLAEDRQQGRHRGTRGAGAASGPWVEPPCGVATGTAGSPRFESRPLGVPGLWGLVVGGRF